MVTCFRPFLPNEWWQIVSFDRVVVVVVVSPVVVVVVVVVVVLLVTVVVATVELLLLTTCSGSRPATELALTAPAAVSAANIIPTRILRLMGVPPFWVRSRRLAACANALL